MHCATCEQVLLKILNLPKSAMLEYKRHGTYANPSPDALKYPIASMLQVGPLYSATCDLRCRIESCTV